MSLPSPVRPLRSRARRLVAAGLAWSSVLVTAAACGSTHAAGTSGSSSQAQRLVIYAAEGYDQAMASAFQQKTGIQVELTDMSTGPLVAKVEAEKAHPLWDVAWFDGDGTMYTLDQEGLLLRNWQPADVSTYTSLGKELQSPDGSYIPTGITAAAAFAYNTKLVTAAEAPTTWTALLQPQWKGAVGMNNPAISGPTFPAVAGLLHQMGTAAGEKYFAQLKANGLQVFPTNKPTLAALASGAIKIAFVQDSAEIQAIAQGAPIHVVYPTDGVTMLPSALGIDAHAQDMAAAKAFAAFVLSPDGQQIMLTQGGGDSNFQPIVQGEEPNPTRQATGIDWQIVPVQWQAQHYNAIQSWFSHSIVG